MVKSKSFGARVFVVVNALVIGLLAASCLIPLIHVFAISLSDKSSASGGLVTLWPVNFTLESYKYVINRAPFWTAMLVSLKRVLVGVSLNMFFCIICAYPLSKETNQFRARTAYAWYFFITMLISGGMIPLLLNFFRQTPRELEEAAIMDGASQWRILWQIFVPTSKAALATVALYSTVYHWNEWFNGIIYSRGPEQYPLQSYMRTIVIDQKLTQMGAGDWEALALVSDKTVKCAMIFVACFPMLVLYPFLQRYFVKGMVLGSVKG